jgi:hypothetical protein
LGVNDAGGNQPNQQKDLANSIAFLHQWFSPSSRGEMIASAISIINSKEKGKWDYRSGNFWRMGKGIKLHCACALAKSRLARSHYFFFQFELGEIGIDQRQVFR